MSFKFTWNHYSAVTTRLVLVLVVSDQEPPLCLLLFAEGWCVGPGLFPLWDSFFPQGMKMFLVLPLPLEI